jgi:hypothetical protein
MSELIRSFINPFLRLKVQTPDGNYSIHSSRAEGPSIENCQAALSARSSSGAWSKLFFGAGGADAEEQPLADTHGSGRRLILTARQAAGGLRLRLEFRLYTDRPYLLMRLTAANEGRETLWLENFTLLAAERRLGGAVRLAAAGGPLEAPAFFKVGWHDWVYSGLRRGRQRDVRTLLKPWVGRMLFDPALPIGRGRGNFWSEGWSVLTQGRQAVVAGFLTLADQFGQVHAVCRPERSSLALIAPWDGVPLAPGEERASEWGYLEFVDLPNPEPLGNYVEAVARETHPRVPALPPPLTWTHWYQFFQDISEERFLAAAQTIGGLTGELPFRALQLDDGYQPTWGDWDRANPRFPHGLEPLVRRPLSSE